ncbi:hypothetical protein D1007_17687 [Hordeum vulgare]|nr:hypothetical protein D1007_17687 [Hordeum vulgare]
MCAEPTSLAVLMAKADKYATADSAMRIKVTALDKVVPAPATPKLVGDNRGGQNNYKRKADQMDPRSMNKLVANVEGEASASQVGPPRKRRNQGNPNWLPKQSLEQLLEAPCKIHSGAMPSTHTLRQCSIACRLSQGEGLPAPPAHVRYIPSGVEPITQKDTSYGTAASVVVSAAAPDVVASPPPAPPEVVAPSPLLRPPASLIPESAYAPSLEAATDSAARTASSELPSAS